jgi:diguanylate cyclase
MDMEKSRFDKSLGLARKVLPFLGEKMIAATPENYMIFYMYFEGESQICKRTVDEQLATDQTWDDTITARIFDQLFGAQANISLFKQNELLAKKVQATTRDLVNESKSAAEIAESTSSNLSDSLERVGQVTEVRQLTDWLRSTMEEVKKVGAVGRGLSQALSQKSEELEDVVKSLGRLEDMALTDELTKLANRRSWDLRISQEWEAFRRNGNPCVLFMLDLDDFKEINDTHGHVVGDEALKAVAKLLADGVGDNGFVARYGGEEFACLLSGIDLSSALRMAENIRENIANTEFTVRGKPVPITASIGAGSFQQGEADFYAAISRTDQAMYRAKSMGKNQVCSEIDL